MAGVEVKRAGRIAYREAAPRSAQGDPVLLVHGYPQSSYMWRHLMPALAEVGRRGVAPDLPGYGDSPPDPPGTWERHVQALERFRREVGLDRLVLVNHDWGGLISMRWALDYSIPLSGLVISNTGFSPTASGTGWGGRCGRRGKARP